MKVYWDTSAVLNYWMRGRMDELIGVTRPHTLPELFSTVTIGFRLPLRIGSLLKGHNENAR